MQTPDDLVVGWGVHIIEGLNRFTVLVCTLVTLLVSGVVAAAWAIARDDVQGGFGIGAWLASVEAVVVMLVVTKWVETRVRTAGSASQDAALARTDDRSELRELR